MDDYQELIEQLRKGFGSAAGRATRVNFYHMWCHKAADAIESMLAENERLKAELAKYRDAHVVAYVQADPDGHLMLAEITKTAEAQQLDKWDKQMGWRLVPLIVKPGE